MAFPYTLPFVLGQKAETLTDDFTTLDTTTKWQTWAATPTIDTGRLSLDAVSGYEGIYTRAVYDLTSSSVSIRVVQPPNIGNLQTSVLMQLRLAPFSGANRASFIIGYP